MNAKVLLLLLLSGCASAPVIRTVAVKVPVSVPCKVSHIPRPSFDIDKLPLGSDIYTQVKSLLITNEQHLGYEVKLEAAVKSCE